MKKMIATFAVLLTLSAGNLFAADGQVSDLDAFGLSDMTVVSDVAGMEVRGMRSFVKTAGWSSSELANSPNNGGYQEYSTLSRNNKRNARASESRAGSFSLSGRGNVVIKNNVIKSYKGSVVGNIGGTYGWAR